MAFQNFAVSNPTKQIACVASLGVSDGHIYIEISGTYYGSKTDFTTAIKPLQDAFPSNVGMKLTTKSRDWYTGLTDFTGPLSTSGPDIYDTFFAKVSSILAIYVLSREGSLELTFTPRPCARSLFSLQLHSARPLLPTGSTT